MTAFYFNITDLPSLDYHAHVQDLDVHPRSRGLLEKLTLSQLVKKFPAFYGTRRFITAFTRAYHLSVF
jgi:hypothetical protein